MEINERGNSTSSGKSRDTIINQQEIRKLMSACNEDWTKLNNLYMAEAKKRKVRKYLLNCDELCCDA